MNKDWPQSIKDVGFDFSWDEKKVWAIDAAIEEMPIEELIWHFDLPFLWHGGGVYNLAPRNVIEQPQQFIKEYERTMGCDMRYPIDVMLNKGKWVILDGLHRLMKASIQGKNFVQVRKIQREKIDLNKK